MVRKYASTTFLRPVADHTRTAFDHACEFVRNFANDSAPFSLVLDSGCGTGESTLHLAKKFPNVPVIGIDKSAVRLTKAGNGRQLECAAEGEPCAAPAGASTGMAVPLNAFWVRAELLDFWRLALEKVLAGEWKILHHALYYPNPGPRKVKLRDGSICIRFSRRCFA